MLFITHLLDVNLQEQFEIYLRLLVLYHTLYVLYMEMNLNKLLTVNKRQSSDTHLLQYFDSLFK
jgi:hypothetical protein